MRRLIAIEWMSLDGVVQAPSSKDEDPSGGFRHGGWHLPYFDPTSMGWVISNLSSADAFVLGRRTYDLFAAHWPNAASEEQQLAQPLNTRPKYVASRTLRAPLAWQNSELLPADLAARISTLKEAKGGDLLAIGSANLVQTLLANDLVDQLRLMIDPIVLGGGKRIFSDDGTRSTWRLAGSEVTATGAILATYSRATRRSLLP